MNKIITNRVLKLCSLLVAAVLCACFSLTGCSLETDTGGSKADTAATIAKANTLQTNQPTPSDIDYSLERYNLIRRAYWVNGKRRNASKFFTHPSGTNASRSKENEYKGIRAFNHNR